MCFVSGKNKMRTLIGDKCNLKQYSSINQDSLLLSSRLIVSLNLSQNSLKNNNFIVEGIAYFSIGVLQLWCAWVYWCFSENAEKLPWWVDWANKYPVRYFSFFDIGSSSINFFINFYYSIAAVDILKAWHYKFEDIYWRKKNRIDLIDFMSEFILTLFFACSGAYMFLGAIDETATSTDKSKVLFRHPELLPTRTVLDDFIYVVGFGLLYLKVANEIAKSANGILGTIFYNFYLAAVDFGFNEIKDVRQKIINDANYVLLLSWYAKAKKMGYISLVNSSFLKSQEVLFNTESMVDYRASGMNFSAENFDIACLIMNLKNTNYPLTETLKVLLINYIHAHDVTCFNDSQEITFKWKVFESAIIGLSIACFLGYLYQLANDDQTPSWLFVISTITSLVFGWLNGRSVAKDFFYIFNEDPYEEPFFSYYTNTSKKILVGLFFISFFSTGSTLYGMQEYFSKVDSFFISTVLGLVIFGIVGAMLFNCVAFNPLIINVSKQLAYIKVSNTIDFSTLTPCEKHGFCQFIIDKIDNFLISLDPKDAVCDLSNMGFEISGLFSEDQERDACEFFSLPSNSQATYNVIYFLAQIISHAIIVALLDCFFSTTKYNLAATIAFYALPAVIEFLLIAYNQSSKNAEKVLIAGIAGFCVDKLLCIYVLEVIKNRKILFSPFESENSNAVLSNGVARLAGCTVQCFSSFFSLNNNTQKNQFVLRR